MPEIEEGDTFKLKERFNIDSNLELGQELTRERNEKTLYTHILEHLEINSLSRKEIANIFGQTKVSGHLNWMLTKLVAEKLIENTIPKILNHPAQQFILTERGRQFLRLVNVK